uniref:Uncharacterized protein n=1 Tax=Arundo donax TaxID=35708 RepID=A0A0A8YGT0_ARUDO
MGNWGFWSVRWKIDNSLTNFAVHITCSTFCLREPVLLQSSLLPSNWGDYSE